MISFSSSISSLIWRSLLMTMTLIAFVFVLVQPAGADWFVDVNAAQNSPVTLQLGAGSYSVAPVYGSDGHYTAWFGGAYHARYNLQFQDTERFLGTTWLFDAPIWAFANGTGTTFNLSSAGPVTFSIDTTGHGDVSGGLSFQVRPNPWPVAPAFAT